MQHMFDPLTKPTANGKPRILISDGLTSHESLDVMTFCFKNNIVLCRLPSHTSHKLQSRYVAVFGLLKTAYREQIERLFRGGAGTIGKCEARRPPPRISAFWVLPLPSIFSSCCQLATF